MEIDENLVIEHRAYARIVLFGNTIDVLFGTAMLLSIRNRSAYVKLEPSKDVLIVSLTTDDRSVQFNSLQHMVNQLQTGGYDGNVSLIMALCKTFQSHCNNNNISLHEGNFKLSYTTSIPRKSGLSSSSAILCAALNCLLDFYDVRHLVKVELRPNLIVDAKKELGIVAGLHGPIAQVYGGLVYIDFGITKETRSGNASYIPMDTSILPPLYLIYAENPDESVEVHSKFRQRWLSGDKLKSSSMVYTFFHAADGRKALIDQEYETFAIKMDDNYDLQREMFRDNALDLNIDVVEVAQKVGVASKFVGTGGSAVAYCPKGSEQEKQLRDACKLAGFTCELVEVAPPLINEVDTETMPCHRQFIWERFLQGQKLKDELKTLYGATSIDLIPFFFLEGAKKSKFDRLQQSIYS